MVPLAKLRTSATSRKADVTRPVEYRLPGPDAAGADNSAYSGRRDVTGTARLSWARSPPDQDSHPYVIEAGPHIFADPDQRFADLIAVIVDAIGRMRTG